MTEDGKEQLAFVCSHVFEQTGPILLVSHADGDWQFLCGGGHEEEEIPQVIGMNHLFERDPSLHQVMNLPKDWEAERASASATWVRSKINA